MPQPPENYIPQQIDGHQTRSKIDESTTEQPCKDDGRNGMEPPEEQEFLSLLGAHLSSLGQTVAQKNFSRLFRGAQQFDEVAGRRRASTARMRTSSVDKKPHHCLSDGTGSNGTGFFDPIRSENNVELSETGQDYSSHLVATPMSRDQEISSHLVAIAPTAPEAILKRAVHRTFLMLDTEQNGYLSPECVHKVVSAQPSMRTKFSLADVRLALIAIIEMAGSNRKNIFNASYGVIPADGLDYASFIWLLNVGNLSDSIENFSHKEKQDVIFAVYHECKSAYEKRSLEEHREVASMFCAHASIHSVDSSTMSTRVTKGKWRKYKVLGSVHIEGEEEEEEEDKLSAVNDVEVKAKRLEIATASIIILNLLMTGVSADVHSDSTVWKVLEYVVKAFFVWEAAYKLHLYGIGAYFCGDDKAWNWFDFLLVVMSIADFFITLAASMSGSGDTTSVSDQLFILKVVRLSRLARMIRLLRFPMFAEMRQMILGVLSGLRVLFWAMVLFNLFIYVLAIILNSTIGKEDVEYLDSFSTVAMSMFTIFRCMTDDCAAENGTPLAVHLVDKFGATFYIGYILTYLFISLGLLNLIMAIFVENVNQAAHKRRQDVLNIDRTQMESHLRKVIEKMIRQDKFLNSQAGKEYQSLYDVSGNMLRTLPCWKRTLMTIIKIIAAIRGVKAYKDPLSDFKSLGLAQTEVTKVFDDFPPITREVFNTWLQRDAMKDVFELLAVDCHSPMHLFDVLDSDMSGLLDVEEIVDGLMYLRGPPEKSDVIATMLSTKVIQRQLLELHQGIVQMYRQSSVNRE